MADPKKNMSYDELVAFFMIGDKDPRPEPTRQEIDAELRRIVKDVRRFAQQGKFLGYMDYSAECDRPLARGVRQLKTGHGSH